MLQIAGDLFRGPGAIVIQLALLAIGGWLMSYIAQALGKGQVAQLVHLAVIFTAFVLVVNLLFTALMAAGRVLGV